MPERGARSTISVSSSRVGGRRPCLKKFALSEDPTPCIPWRVLSLPNPALARGGEEAVAAEEDSPLSKNEFDNGSTTRANGENTAVCWVHSSSSNRGAPTAMGKYSKVDGETFSGSSKPPKGALPALSLILDDELSRDSSTAARRRTQVVRAASCERAASVRTELQIEMPNIRVSDSRATESPCLATAPPEAQYCDRREWSAAPPIKTYRVANCRLHPQEEAKPDNAPKASANEVREARKALRVPKAPPRPRYIWEVLRRRTLQATQREPSVFRRNIQSKLEGEADAVPETTQAAPWLVLNRRIFGVREVASRGVIAFPEWMMFSAGVPPSGFDETSRWALRLGRNRESAPRKGASLGRFARW